MRCLKFLMLALLLSSFAGAQASSADSKSGPAEMPKLVPGFDVNAIDKSAQPCQDFYQYSCGNWLKSNPVPADKASYGRFTELFERNRAVLHQILEKASANDAGRNAVQQKIGDYYASCMDVPAIDAKGLAPAQAELDRINAMKSKADLAPELARLHDMGVNALFELDSQQDAKNSEMMIAAVYQGGQGLPERDFYFNTDPKSQNQRNEYVAHIRKMFELMGDKPDDAQLEATTVMSIETALARSSFKRQDVRDPSKTYHPTKVADLAKSDPAFDWKQYLAGRELGKIDWLNVAVPPFITGMQDELENVSLADWKTYLRWQLVHSQAMELPSAFDEENFHFFGTVLRGTKEQEPRWKRCVSATDGDLGEALGQQYVAETFGPDAKARTMKMIDALETALHDDIQTLPWMSDETRKQALVKLQAIARKIGYPDKWRDYSTLNVVRGDALGNSLRANQFEDHRQMAKVGHPVDRAEWEMTPPTVNAYYDPQMNNINFPAGILQPPFFDKSIDDAVNFGGIGAVIGHELTHGFDNEGSQFDPQGNLRDWWTPTDKKEFEKRTQCVDDEYSKFVVKDPENSKNDVHVNGRMTLGENTADNGGLRIALMALEDTMRGKQAGNVDGFTPEQRLFLAWGQIWCTNYRPDSARLQTLSNEHALGPYRVNGVVENMPEFEKAFSCKKGDSMVSENACRVW